MVAQVQNEVDVNNTKAVSLRDIPEDVWHAARVEALKRKMTMSEYIVYVLRRAVAVKS